MFAVHAFKQLCQYRWFIDQACSVKMAGYWPDSFLACLLTETESRKKKERGQYPAILTEQAWSIKDLFYGFRTIFFAEHSG